MIELTLSALLRQKTAEYPDNEFMVYSDRDLRFTYTQFDKRVDDMACGLYAIGVRKGDHVGIWATNVPDWLTYMFACARLGAVAVTVNTSYKLHELEYLVKQSDLTTLCLTDGVKDSNYVSMIKELVPELDEYERGCLKSKLFPCLRNVVFMGPEKYKGLYSTPELLLLGQHVDIEIIHDIEKSVTQNDVVNMQYTSGTTGFPKGVMLTSRNIINNGYSIGECMRYTNKERVCLPVPLFHCFGIVLGVMAVLSHGATHVLLESFDPLLALASIHKEKCTAIYGVPTMYIAELNHPMFSMFDMSSLRTGIMAGSLCPVELMKQVMEKMNMKEITSVYGLTETSPGMTQSHWDDTLEVKATTVGRELPDIEVKVLDPETNEECPVGVQGEMCCRGYNIMKGYYKMPKETEEIIDENGFLHSGDLGVKGEDGNYRITGRIKDMIIRGGENIYPREIEEFLSAMPEIRDIQVAAVKSKRYGEITGAFIILHEGKTLTEQDVIEFCRDKLAKFKWPQLVMFVDEFPLTGSGKIQKFKLTEIGTKYRREVLKIDD
ncbi:MAG: AMP-binding protein [Treponema sp.]|uniref:AMP-binding protein n=1 Tax=Treponema sp. TaxID=166 RepID=UPI00298E4FB5|nr:AMP-binding protein [Treponema sp.]MCI5665404.1 AMP-binding protein [Spirochaetia bacterium]MDY3130551.1 AMP-binding protein [Treponema sp.]